MNPDETVTRRGVDAGEAAGAEADGGELRTGEAAGPDPGTGETSPGEAAGSDADDGVAGPEPDTAEMVFGRPPTRPGDRRRGGAAVVAGRARVADTAPLIEPDQLEALQRRWGTAQAGFVDDPRRAVEVADEIVATALAALQSAVGDRVGELSAWRDDANASTDVLLAAFQGYRAVFERVMSA